MINGNPIQTKNIDVFVRYKKNNKIVDIRYFCFRFDTKIKKRLGNSIDVILSAYSKLRVVSKL